MTPTDAAAAGRNVSPQRIQLSRSKGWRKPEGAVIVSRPSRWGNPYRRKGGMNHTLVDQFGNEYSCAPGEWRGVAVRRFREDLVADRLDLIALDDVEVLAGKDLACWCPLDQPCHADVLLEIANRVDE